MQIFLSYCHADEQFVRRLADDLKKIGADIRIDFYSIPAGTKWSHAVQEGLDSCKLMLVCVSPESIQSKNVDDEWQYYHEIDKPIIVLMLKPTELHFQLRRFTQVNFADSDYRTGFFNLHRELLEKKVLLPAREMIEKMSGLSFTHPPTGVLTHVYRITCRYCKADNFKPRIGDPCGKCGMPLTLEVEKPKSVKVQTTPIPIPEELQQKLKIRLYIAQKEKVLEVELKSGTPVTIGRGDGTKAPDVDLNPYSGDKDGISRFHAAILLQKDKLYVGDMGSMNGTFLNENPLPPKKRHPVVSGDTLRLGGLIMEIEIPF